MSPDERQYRVTAQLKSVYQIVIEAQSPKEAEYFEAYPDLKASTNFLQLQEELATTENKVSFSRQFYNDSVRNLNTAIASIPTSFFVGVAKVSERAFYEVDDPTARNTPNVRF
jgi:LemA protein